MMPLIMAETGVIQSIKKINGKDDTKQFLKNLGFVEGSEITIISQILLLVNLWQVELWFNRGARFENAKRSKNRGNRHCVKINWKWRS